MGAADAGAAGAGGGGGGGSGASSAGGGGGGASAAGAAACSPPAALLARIAQLEGDVQHWKEQARLAWQASAQVAAEAATRPNPIDLKETTASLAKSHHEIHLAVTHAFDFMQRTLSAAAKDHESRAKEMLILQSAAHQAALALAAAAPAGAPGAGAGAAQPAHAHAPPHAPPGAPGDVDGGDDDIPPLVPPRDLAPAAVLNPNRAGAAAGAAGAAGAAPAAGHESLSSSSSSLASRNRKRASTDASIGALKRIKQEM